MRFYRRAMEHLFVAVVIAVTLRMTSADDDSCEVHPVFNTKERSSDFFASEYICLNRQVRAEL